MVSIFHDSPEFHYHGLQEMDLIFFKMNDSLLHVLFIEHLLNTVQNAVLGTRDMKKFIEKLVLWETTAYKRK